MMKRNDTKLRFNGLSVYLWAQLQHPEFMKKYLQDALYQDLASNNSTNKFSIALGTAIKARYGKRIERAAEKSGVSVPTIYRIAAGKQNNIKLETLVKLLELVGMNIHISPNSDMEQYSKQIEVTRCN